MPRPKGLPKTGGRKKGTPNHATADLKALCVVHTPQAVREIVKLAETSENPQVRLAAWKEILDRGHGRATQTIAGEGEGGALVINVVR